MRRMSDSAPFDSSDSETPSFDEDEPEVSSPPVSNLGISLTAGIALGSALLLGIIYLNNQSPVDLRTVGRLLFVLAIGTTGGHYLGKLLERDLELKDGYIVGLIVSLILFATGRLVLSMSELEVTAISPLLVVLYLTPVSIVMMHYSGLVDAQQKLQRVLPWLSRIGAVITVLYLLLLGLDAISG